MTARRREKKMKPKERKSENMKSKERDNVSIYGKSIEEEITVNSKRREYFF